MRKYLQYKYDEGIDERMNPTECLNELSLELKEDLCRDVYLRALNKISSLSKNFSNKFLKKLSFSVYEIIYGTGESLLPKDV